MQPPAARVGRVGVPVVGRIGQPVAGRSGGPRTAGLGAEALPPWPVAAVLLAVPAWWLLGIGDLAFVLGAAVMVFLLVRRGTVRVPSGFAIWLLFLVWMLFSVIEIDSGGRLAGFVYRAALYLAMTVIFVYVYNGRPRLTPRHVAGILTGYWLVVVAGGYVGVLFPLLTITTPVGVLLPDSLLSNELVHEIVVRQTTQFNIASTLDIDPRPSAPFLYTNGWGNAYSLLMPVVVAYLLSVRGERKFWWLLAAIPVSFVPALLTLNRGMFLGLGIAALYAIVRLLLMRRVAAVLALLAAVAVLAAAFFASPIEDRLLTRLDESSTTQDRANLYQETVERTLESPLFGYGAPRPSEIPGAPSTGTQGQFWMVMFSHGFPAVVLFLGWFLWAFMRSWRHRDPIGVALSSVLLLALVESLYYGLLTSGLPIAMMAAGVTLRDEKPAAVEP